MPLGTVDRTPPPFFKQGPSALSKLLVLSALAVLLMVVDARRHWAQPLRSALAVALYPVQWLALQPLQGAQWTTQYVGSLRNARQEADAARAELVRQSQRAAIVEHLAQENRELRGLLTMRERLPTDSRGAEILYQLPDSYRQRVVIDAGTTQGVQPGSPVMDGYGVLGQVSRVYGATAEVTLLTDRQQAIPVINTRTGQRSLAYGLPDSSQMELRFESVNTEAEVGDILTTSGIDGIYPPGLPVAKIAAVSTRDGSGFARIVCDPMARISNTLHVLVVNPMSSGQRPGLEARP